MGILLGAVGLGVLLWLAGRAGWFSISFFGFTFNRPREKTADELKWQREDQLRERDAEQRQVYDSFRRYADAAVGMATMVEAPGPADRTLIAWFDLAAEELAAGLTTFPEDHFRVAIWADLGDPDSFHLLGAANHNKNDPKMRTLSKADTIGGHAWRSKDGEYLCADIKKDRRFHVRSPAPRPYKQILAISVGQPARWGVVTIDAPRAGAFGETEWVIARRFCLLVAAGAAVAGAKYAPAAGRVETLPIGSPARIVGPAIAPGEAVAQEGPDGDA